MSQINNTMRRYLLLIIGLSVVLSSLMAQFLNSNTDLPVIVNDSSMFIGQNTDSLTEEERYFNPLYLVVQKGKEHLKNQLVRASVCDCDTTIPNRTIGVFSVAKDKQVTFSQGNLQYFPAANLWKFADAQYECLGNSNKYLSPTYRNWVDLFGWSGDNTTAPFGISTSTNSADFAGEFVSWGTNWICGDKPGTWRSLSIEEWDYLLHMRINAAQLRCIAQVNGVNGLILLPDCWICPQGISLKSGFSANYGAEHFAKYQSFTKDQWMRLEQSGAVFLPAIGCRAGVGVLTFQQHGNYWSMSQDQPNKAYSVYFHSSITRIDNDFRFHGHAVRRVRDTVLQTPESYKIIEVNGVIFNMIRVDGGTFVMGASDDDDQATPDERPQHSVTLSDFYIGQTEVTQALWEAVMGNNPSVNKASKNHPVENVSWNDCQQFISELNQLTGLSFRLPTEAEWEYAAKGGQRSQGYKYAGSDVLNDVAWYEGNTTSSQPVAQKCSNELGLYDMTGNMYELCHDWYASYSDEPQTNPQGASSSSNGWRVLRGGCWQKQNSYTYEHCCRNTNRGYNSPTSKNSYCGLRLVLNE